MYVYHNIGLEKTHDCSNYNEIISKHQTLYTYFLLSRSVSTAVSRPSTPTQPRPVTTTSPSRQAPPLPHSATIFKVTILNALAGQAHCKRADYTSCADKQNLCTPAMDPCALPRPFLSRIDMLFFTWQLIQIQLNRPSVCGQVEGEVMAAFVLCSRCSSSH